MKKILLVLDGEVAQDFLQNLCMRGGVNNQYLIVAKNEEIREKLPVLEKGRFQICFFDPTSPSKLLPLLSKTITNAFVIMQDKQEGQEVYRILRQYSSRIIITLLGDEGMGLNDKNVEVITEVPLVSSHLVARIPNIPLIPKDIGLGLGEIMQVSIPFGSSFAYRSIGSITQKNWKIVALYRNGKMMLAKYSLIMEPNDSLLIVGDSHILLEVYHRIREELGQFPFPFGRNLVLYCDCGRESPEETQASIQEALYLHGIFKDRKLYIRVLNPTNPETIASLIAKQRAGVDVSMVYHKKPLVQVLEEDKKVLGIGLVMLRECLFASHKLRALLYKLTLPTLRLGDNKLEELQGCSVLLGDKTRQSEQIASVAFDISSQLKQTVILYDFAPDLQWHHESVDHYESMSKIFDSKLEVISSAMANPLIWLMKNRDILGVFPLTKGMTGRKFLGPFSTNIAHLSLSFIRSHKLFIPIGHD